MPENNENMQLREIEELKRKLAEKEAAFETGTPQIENREAEMTKENLQESLPPQTIPSQQKTTTTTDNDRTKIEEIKKDVGKIKNLDTARQVEVLLTLAFEKGINHSVSVARKLNDAYLLDELHDKLVGELHEELVKRGKLKEI